MHENHPGMYGNRTDDDASISVIVCLALTQKWCELWRMKHVVTQAIESDAILQSPRHEACVNVNMAWSSEAWNRTWWWRITILAMVMMAEDLSLYDLGLAEEALGEWHTTRIYAMYLS